MASDLKTTLKLLLLQHPDLDLPALQSALIESGFRVSTVLIAAIKSDFTHTMRVLQQQGWLVTDKPPIRHKRKSCSQCGRSFIPARVDASFCSHRCRQRHYRERQATERSWRRFEHL
jgi:hypothetical protein